MLLPQTGRTASWLGERSEPSLHHHTWCGIAAAPVYLSIRLEAGAWAWADCSALSSSTTLCRAVASVSEVMSVLNTFSLGWNFLNALQSNK